MKSMERVLRYDGLLPSKLSLDGTQGEILPEDIRAMKAYVDRHRTLTTPFDIVMEGRTLGDDREQAAASVRPYVEAGITWWIEAMWTAPNGPEDLRRRIQQGPPRTEG